MSEGARCIVLGGTGALGRRVCRDLTAGGARVAFSYRRSAEAARALEDEHEGAFGLALEAEERGAVAGFMAAAIEGLGGLDALVHCLGVGVTRPGGTEAHVRIDELEEDDFERMMAINVRSAFSACKAAAPALRQAGGGNIVLMASIDGVKPVPAPVHYAASKAAILGLTKTLAKELGPDRIRVNVLAPGVMSEGISRTLPAELIAEYEKHCGMKRRAEPGEISALIAYLALENSYVNGQTIVVDGAL